MRRNRLASAGKWQRFMKPEPELAGGDPPADNLVAVRPTELRVPARSKYTALRRLFAAAEAIGEFVGIRYGYLRRQETEPKWLYYSHKDFDGIGAFAEILRSRGAGLGPLPEIKYYPAVWAGVSALRHWPRYLAPKHPLPWISMERDSSPPWGARPPFAVAWHVFDEPTTSGLRLGARSLGITVNTFLLDALTQAVRTLLVDPSAPVPWMIPVNMRGGVRQFREVDNHTSYVAIQVPVSDAASDIHRKILKALSRGEHWGNWHAFKLANFIPHSMRTRLAASGKALSQWSMGAFSNLGEWDADRRLAGPDIEGAWLFCPPALRTQMIAAGCVTFQGRLTLTLQTHPALTTSPARVQTLVGSWVSAIKASLAAAAAEPSVRPRS